MTDNATISAPYEILRKAKFQVGDAVEVLWGNVFRYGVIIKVYAIPYINTNKLVSEDKTIWKYKYDIKINDSDDINPDELLCYIPEEIVRRMYRSQDKIYVSSKPYTSSDYEQLNNKSSSSLYYQAINAMKKYESERNNKEMGMPKYKNVLYPTFKDLNIDKVIFNNPATIIYWNSWHLEKVENKDGTTKQIQVQDKTVVKCSPGEPFSKYAGFCAAVTKYLFGNNSMVSRIVSEAQDHSKKVTDKKTKKEVKKILTSNDDTCPYYISKEGRKYTCKQVYNCDGVKKDKCIEYQKQTSKKSKGGKKK